VGKKPYEFVDFSLKKRLEEELTEREEKETKKRFKICPKCGLGKLLFNFSVDKRSSDNHTGVCKSCRKQKALIYYSENREEILIRTREYGKTHKVERSLYSINYREKNKRHLKAVAKKWYKKNKKEIKKRNIKYYNDHKEACNQRRKLWIGKNKEKIKKYNREYARTH